VLYTEHKKINYQAKPKKKEGIEEFYKSQTNNKIKFSISKQKPNKRKL